MKKKRFKPAGWVRLFAALLFGIAPAACQPSIIPAAQPTPRILTVAVTPALQSLSPIFQSCANALENTGLIVLDTPAQAIDLKQSHLALRWGPAETALPYAAVLGQEELVLVVNPKNPIQHISLDDVKGIYTGTLQTWNGVSSAAINAWAYPKGDDVEAVFEAAVTGAPVSTRLTSTAPDPKAMREAIAADPAAVGFLPRRWLDATVKAVALDGSVPDRFRQPILAISPSEPAGLEKSWLLCVQQHLKE